MTSCYKCLLGKEFNVRRPLAPEQSHPTSRPPLFRALGDHEPPQTIDIEGELLERGEILKHDSWAATALYHNDTRIVVCKFNRMNPIGFVPSGWLGAFLARRERRMYEMLEDVPNIPKGISKVVVDGRTALNAVAHDYVAGHPLRWYDRVGDRFFAALQETVDEMHRRGIAYVDMNKSENIIVGADGKPYLVDFQISIRLFRIWPLSLLLGLLQQSDRYHLRKHIFRFRPDLQPCNTKEFVEARPWWISWYRKIGVPMRGLRRKLLVRLGIRSGPGQAHTEVYVEDALRCHAQENETPLLQLHATLISDGYYQLKGEDHDAYVFGMFNDLTGRAHSEQDMTLLYPMILDRRSRHDVSSVMLRSSEVFTSSRHLSDEWLIGINDKIRQQLCTQ
jgi:hypothetical protein